MDNIEINIPDISFKKDFTIIYKGSEGNITEIKTSKEEFIRKFRYFKRRTAELNQMNEIYIHETYCNEIFKTFINTLETHKIEINDENINDLLSLSRKYEYDELDNELTIYSKSRPDLQRIFEQTKTKELDRNQEEKLSKNLDICLQNEHFFDLPLSVLTRILKSPNRHLEDHHLLFEFIKKIIQKYKNSNNKNKKNEKENLMNLQVILSCLDYREMSDDELDELFNNEEITSIFNFCHQNERMKQLIYENRAKEERQASLETQLSQLSQRFTEFAQLSKEKDKQSSSMIEEIKKRIFATN